MLTQVELELFGKVLLAGLLGFVVGLERELIGSAAGDRTFSLVAIWFSAFHGSVRRCVRAGSGRVARTVAAN